MDKKIINVQKLLQKHKIDGWLLYDYKRSNPIAIDFLEIPKEFHLTRRFFYWIPQAGMPIKICCSIENPLRHLPGRERIFFSWQELEKILQETLSGIIAMEYSPAGAIPALSKVDGGTLELVKRHVKSVVSSQEIAQPLFVPLSPEQIASHKRAAAHLEEIAELAFDLIRSKIGAIEEMELQQFLLDQFARRGLVTEGSPIVAAGSHTMSPHYAPSKATPKTIEREEIILLDMWAKESGNDAVFADYTYMASSYAKTPKEMERVFAVVKEAQEKAIELIEGRVKEKKPVFGFEVDRAARDYIVGKGYGPNFVHRTGHNIHREDHGPGTNNDDLESHDTRAHLPSTICSIEPGIYLPNQFGVRLECNVIIYEDSVEVTGPRQASFEII